MVRAWTGSRKRDTPGDGLREKGSEGEWRRLRSESPVKESLGTDCGGGVELNDMATSGGRSGRHRRWGRGKGPLKETAVSRSRE